MCICLADCGYTGETFFISNPWVKPWETLSVPAAAGRGTVAATELAIPAISLSAEPESKVDGAGGWTISAAGAGAFSIDPDFATATTLFSLLSSFAGFGFTVFGFRAAVAAGFAGEGFTSIVGCDSAVSMLSAFGLVVSESADGPVVSARVAIAGPEAGV